MKIKAIAISLLFAFGISSAIFAEEAKSDSGAPRVMVTYTTVEAVELEQNKDGTFKVLNMKSEKIPNVIKDPSITLADDRLKENVQKALTAQKLKQGENVTLGVGETLGGLVGGAANIASPVVSVVGAVVPHIEQIVGLVGGIAKFL